MAAGYGGAQAIGDQARRLAVQAAQATDPQQAAQLREQASQFTNGAHQMADAVGSSFADAVAHTSLVGASILSHAPGRPRGHPVLRPWGAAGAGSRTAR